MRTFIEQQTAKQSGYLAGKLLVSMPFMADARFTQTVIYLCGHDSKGAIGLITNKPLNSLNFQELLRQLEIAPNYLSKKVAMHYGGPVEVSRGFVLHSADYVSDSTVMVNEIFAVTSTLDVLRNLAQGYGPKNYLVTLGYVGWAEGQLEQELHDNVWMVVEATEELVFNFHIEVKWRAALAQIGVDPAVLSLDSGHA